MGNVVEDANNSFDVSKANCHINIQYENRGKNNFIIEFFLKKNL